MMALPFQTIRSPCVEWKTELPHIQRDCVSPVFNDELHDTSVNLSLCGYYHVAAGCEGWEVSLKSLAFKTSVEKKLGISVYFEETNGELMKCFHGERNYKVTEFTDFFNFDRYFLREKGITGDKVSLFFVFDSKYVSDILQEKPMDDVQPETLSKSIQTLCLQTSKSTQTSCLQTSCHQSFSKDIEKFFDNAEHSDVVLRCDDRSFSVNKYILSARSDVFAAMFRNKMSEKETGVIAVEDIQPAIMEQFLRYLYSGRVDSLCADSVFDLYRAGDKYAVPSLKRKCASFMAEQLSGDNVCQVLLVAHTFADTELLDTAASFAAAKAKFLKSEEWNTFAEEHSTVAVKVYMKFHAT